MSFIQCCLLTACLVVLAAVVVISVALSGWAWKFGRYAYERSGEVEPLSLLSLSSDYYAYDLQLSLFITAIGLMVLAVVVCLAYMFYVTARVQMTKLHRCLCPCSAQRPARNSLSYEMDEYQA